MDDKTKKVLQERLKAAKEERVRLNGIAEEVKTQEIIQIIIEIIDELNINTDSKEAWIPFLMLEYVEKRKIDIEPKMSCIKDNSTIAKLIEATDGCSEKSWKQVKDFLKDIFTCQDGEYHFMISFLDE